MHHFSSRARLLLLSLPCLLWLTGLLGALASPAAAELRAGAAVADITPPIGTPSAGYGDRLGAGMTGVHDPLLATALALDNGVERLVFVGVDHLGFDHGMVQEVATRLSAQDARPVELFLGSSHTHAGGGAYLDVPVVGEVLAGKFDPAARQLYVDGAARAAIEAVAGLQPARIGLTHGEAPGLNRYRGDWPPNVSTRPDLMVIKVTTVGGEPLAVLFDYAAHATVLPGANREFSADFVGFARQAIQARLGAGTVAVYFNGAQGDVSPAPPGPETEEPFARARSMGGALAAQVLELWAQAETSERLEIAVARLPYQLDVQPTSTGIELPIDARETEIGLVVLDRVHALLAVPGELSTIYDADLERFAAWLGYRDLTILGLTNDAHGYIITPESWRHRTYESTVSFGGELYGERVESLAQALLHQLEPAGAYQEQRAVPSELLGDSPAAPAGAPP